MEKIIFENHEELAECMISVANHGDTAYAICFMDDASELLKELMRYDDVTIGGINISQEEYNGYSKEYYVSIDGNMIVDVEPAWHKANEYHDAGYLWFDADKVFIVGEANSAIIKNVDKDKCYEIGFETPKDDDFIEKLFENAMIVTDENDNPIGLKLDLMALLNDLFGE